MTRDAFTNAALAYCAAAKDNRERLERGEWRATMGREPTALYAHDAMTKAYDALARTAHGEARGEPFAGLPYSEQPSSAMGEWGRIADRLRRNARAMAPSIGVTPDDAEGFAMACLVVSGRPPTQEELDYAKTLATPPAGTDEGSKA